MSNVMLSFNNHVKPSPEIRPLYNISILFDPSSGSYVLGANGESILNAGLARITGIGGLPNTYKSTVGDFMNLCVLDKYQGSASVALDSEMSKTHSRQLMLAQRFENLKNGDFLDEGRLVNTDTSVQTLDHWFDDVKAYCDHKTKIKSKDVYGTLPMRTRHGQPVKVLRNSIAMVDSLSRATLSVTDTMLAANSVGDSKNNTEALRNNHAKNQFLIQLPTLTEKANTSFIMTAHVDDNLNLDPYAPPKTKLAFLGNKMKFKYVPNQFYFLTNNLWYCYSAKPFVNKDKVPMFPMTAADVGCDLMIIQMQNLRGKYGVSGLPITLLASQSEGILEYLSLFYLLREQKGIDNKEWAQGFGISGNNLSYYLDIYPDVKLSRTTVRRKIDEDPKLRRAIEITAEILQIYQYHKLKPEFFALMPTLYEDLIAKGYDWDVLLKTRYHWVYEEDEIHETRKQLTGMDFLRMRAGKYHPYWMKDMPAPAGTTIGLENPITGEIVTPLHLEEPVV